MGRGRLAGFELDAYLERIGLTGRPELAEVHRAHVRSVPFENLDPLRGVPVSLDPEALANKLVADRRGGYCFEQNLLFAAALEALGATVEPLLARVRWGVPPELPTPRTHLVLRVLTSAGSWLADVGFGNGTLVEPVPFGPGGPHEQLGWRFRIVEVGGEHMLQTDVDGTWTDVYAISPVPVPHIDIEVSNWFTATHPESRFVSGLIVTTQLTDGTRVSLSDWNELALAVRTPAASTVTPVAREEIPALLDEHFGLSGFALDAAGTIAPARAY